MKNLIIYNFPEISDYQANKEEVSKIVFNLDLSITNVICLGKRNDEKPRLLFVGLDNNGTKSKFFLSPASFVLWLTKLNMRGRNTKEVVDELKSRRSKGEKNLIIRSGGILHQHLDVEYL